MEALFTRQEAAARLRVSTKTLDKHVAAGVLRYVSIGLGRQHIRRMFAPSDLEAFIEAQTRKDVPLCPSRSPATRPSTTTRSIPRSSLSRLNQGHVKAGGRRSRAPRARQGEGGCRSAQGRLDLAPARRRRRTLLAGDRSASRRRQHLEARRAAGRVFRQGQADHRHHRRRRGAAGGVAARPAHRARRQDRRVAVAVHGTTTRPCS